MDAVRSPHTLLRIAVGLLAVATGVAGEPKPGVNWPQFRGPNAAGVAEGFPTPSTWDVTGGKNVRWKSAIPGLGLSAPAIWGDRIFLTTAVGVGRDQAELKVGLYGEIAPVDENFDHQWKVLCLDKKSGKVLWEAIACTGVPQIKRHTKASHANSTPATDGKHVVAFFGAEGLYCYDMNGKLLWKKDFGKLDSGYYAMPQAQWGFASSPIIHEGRVIVQCDVQQDSFIAALDVKDGRELWRTPRTDVPSWSTPTIVAADGRTQVVANGHREIAGYDFKTGKKLWDMEGGGDIPVPTPVLAHDLIYLASAHGGPAPIFAVRTSASGEVDLPAENSQGRFVAWWNGRVGVYMQTLLVVGDELYGCRDNGVLNVFDARTGEKRYQQRLGGGSSGFTASPVAADGKVYFTSETGDVYVVKAGATFEQIAMNPLGEVCMATPAISEGVIYFRGQKHLIAVGE